MGASASDRGVQASVQSAAAVDFLRSQRALGTAHQAVAIALAERGELREGNGAAEYLFCKS